MKNCPYCSEQIQDSAKKCRFCGEFISESSSAIPEKTITQIRSQKGVKNSWQKTFYWTLGIGVAIFLSSFASVQNGGDMTGMFAGPGVILASLGHFFIQKRREGKGIYTIGEVMIGMTLGFFALLSDPKQLFQNPITLLGLALFLSYYIYPFINTKIKNKWGKISFKIVSVIIILFAISMSIVSYKTSMQNSRDRAEFESAMKESGVPVR